jgi:hypothetical protein
MDSSIVIAAIGGFALNLLQLMELSKIPKERRPDFKDWLYWLPYIGWPFLGASLAFVYSASAIELKPIVAFNVGLSAPLIIRSLAAANPFEKTTINPGIGA